MIKRVREARRDLMFHNCNNYAQRCEIYSYVLHFSENVLSWYRLDGATLLKSLIRHSSEKDYTRI